MEVLSKVEKGLTQCPSYVDDYTCVTTSQGPVSGRRMHHLQPPPNRPSSVTVVTQRCQSLRDVTLSLPPINQTFGILKTNPRPSESKPGPSGNTCCCDARNERMPQAYNNSGCYPVRKRANKQYHPQCGAGRGKGIAGHGIVRSNGSALVSPSVMAGAKVVAWTCRASKG